MDKKQKEFLKSQAFKGKDIVDEVVRLCVMNLFLHGNGGFLQYWAGTVLGSGSNKNKGGQHGQESIHVGADFQQAEAS